MKFLRKFGEPVKKLKMKMVGTCESFQYNETKNRRI
jgi:hypothetical protein